MTFEKPLKFGSLVNHHLSLYVILFILYSPQILSQTTKQNNAVIDMSVNNGLLTLDVVNIRLDIVLQTIAKSANFDLHINGELNQTISSSINSVPLGDAVKILAGNNSTVMILGDTQQNDQRIIREVWIYSTGNKIFENANTLPVVTDAYQISLSKNTPAENNVNTIRLLKDIIEQDDSGSERKNAIQELAMIGDLAALETLEIGLGDDDDTVRNEVIKALSQIDEQRSSLALGQVILGDPDPAMRMEALESIAWHNPDIARIFVDAAAIDDTDMSVRDTAEKILLDL